VREDGGDVIAEAQQQGLVAEQLERALERAPLRRGLHEPIGAGEVVVEDLADGAAFLPEVLDDGPGHRGDGLLDALEVARELSDEVDEVRVPVAHLRFVDGADVAAVRDTRTLRLQLGDLRVEAADVTVSVGAGAVRPPVDGVDDHRQPGLADERPARGQRVDERERLERMRGERVLLVAVGGVRPDEPLRVHPLAAERAAGGPVGVLVPVAARHAGSGGGQARDVLLHLEVHPVRGDVLHVTVEHGAEHGDDGGGRRPGHEPERGLVQDGADAAELEIDVRHGRGMTGGEAAVRSEVASGCGGRCMGWAIPDSN